jgi:hypothetical protein
MTAPLPDELPGGALPVLLCGARTRNGGTCKRTAGHATDHLGQGKCNLHGGLTPIKHGRYSKIKRKRLRVIIERHEQDDDPLNLLPEVAALRGLFEDFINRYDETTEALLAWHASFQLTRRPLPEPLVMSFERIVDEWEIALKEERLDASDRTAEDVAQARKFIDILRNGTDEAKPRKVLDISDAHKILDSVGRMVERIESVRAQNSISRAHLDRILHEMLRSIDLLVPDEELRSRIKEQWLTIAL